MKKLSQFLQCHTVSPGHKPLVVNVVILGPFEDEEEGEVVKVKARVNFRPPKVV